MRQAGWHLKAKRGLDKAVAAVAAVALSPLMVATAAAVGASMGRPVLFRQVRPGLHGRPFELIKFRTMANRRGRDGQMLSDEQRLTRVGRILRSTSLDELPQLYNVLRGDMSLVGPRPLLCEYLDRYSPRQARRHEVLPGITGWQQINGRNTVSWEEKFEQDVWYVENWSLWLDLKILIATAAHVVKRTGVSHEGHATMPVFRGSGQPS